MQGKAPHHAPKQHRGRNQHHEQGQFEHLSQLYAPPTKASSWHLPEATKMKRQSQASELRRYSCPRQGPGPLETQTRSSDSGPNARARNESGATPHFPLHTIHNPAIPGSQSRRVLESLRSGEGGSGVRSGKHWAHGAGFRGLSHCVARCTPPRRLRHGLPRITTPDTPRPGPALSAMQPSPRPIV